MVKQHIRIYRTSPVMYDHKVYHVTATRRWHIWMHPALSPAGQDSTQFTYSG